MNHPVNHPKNSHPANRGDVKSLLSALKMTTTIGAVSLTLAGWGLLARVEAINANQADPIGATTTVLTSSTAGSAFGAQPASLISPESVAAATRSALAPAAAPTQAPATLTAAPTSTAAPTATPTTEPTAAPQTVVKLNVVQWTQTNAGDPIAVVQDNGGTLWYVWGPDVSRIEQGLQPQYQPVPVNQVARSRRS